MRYKIQNKSIKREKRCFSKKEKQIRIGGFVFRKNVLGLYRLAFKILHPAAFKDINLLSVASKAKEGHILNTLQFFNTNLCITYCMCRALEHGTAQIGNNGHAGSSQRPSVHRSTLVVGSISLLFNNRICIFVGK